MFSCNEFLAEFGNYLEGDLATEMRRELEIHLDQCTSCQVIVDSTRKTLKIVTESGKHDLSMALPEPVVESIMERIRAKARGE
jgi:hypothetical protein